MLAGIHKVAGLLCLTSQIFAPGSDAGKLPRDIDELLHAAANLLNVPLHARTAIAQNLPGPTLVPVQATGLNDLIQQPTLLAPAFHLPFSLNSHLSLLQTDEKDPSPSPIPADKAL